MNGNPAVDSRTALPIVERLHVVVRIAAERFAFSVADVDEVREMPDLECASGATAGFIGQLRCGDRTVSAYDAAWVLGVPREKSATGAATQQPAQEAGALVLRRGAARVAIVVDEVEDLVMVEREWLRRVPGGADAESVLSAVYRAPRHQGGLVCIVRVPAVFAVIGEALP